MSQLIVTANTRVDLKPSPIEPSWIIEGTPIARNAILDRSADGMATIMVWECTEGRFHWHYDFDETVHVLEGAITLESDDMPAARFGPGDVIVFKKRAKARWHVHGHVRKLAFCRRTQPAALGFALRAAGKLKALLARSHAGRTASLVDAA